MTLRAIIVDDEPLAQLRIKRLLTELGGVDTIAVGENGKQAIELVNKFQPDLLFLDIQMPVMSGLDAAYQIAELDNPPAIIFCTAFDKYTLEAFKANAVAYLLKPIRQNEVVDAVQNAAKVSKAQLKSLAGETKKVAQTLSIHSHGEIERWPLASFLYFRADDKFVVAGLRQGGEIVVDYTLKELEKEFGNQFVRTHRQSLVSRNDLCRLFRDGGGQASVTINGIEQSFAVSRRHLSEVKKCFIND